MWSRSTVRDRTSVGKANSASFVEAHIVSLGRVDRAQALRVAQRGEQRRSQSRYHRLGSRATSSEETKRFGRVKVEVRIVDEHASCQGTRLRRVRLVVRVYVEERVVHRRIEDLDDRTTGRVQVKERVDGRSEGRLDERRRRDEVVQVQGRVLQRV
jgi:hypothetical protein